MAWRRKTVARVAVLGGALALGACAVASPSGPTVMALPPAGKSMARFQQDDLTCRQYASASVGGATPSEAANNAAVGSALLGTALGAAAGAAIGSVGAQVGAGAAIGGAAGLLLGSAIGANNASASAYSLQQRYNIGYTQCMAAHGNTVEAAPGAYAAYPYPATGYPSTYGYYGYPYAPYAFGPSVGFGFGW
ncbi:MAG: YMGG-like glycine zipper-containing protein [Acetobacteraceae bacterium]